MRWCKSKDMLQKQGTGDIHKRSRSCSNQRKQQPSTNRRNSRWKKDGRLVVRNRGWMTATRRLQMGDASALMPLQKWLKAPCLNQAVGPAKTPGMWHCHAAIVGAIVSPCSAAFAGARYTIVVPSGTRNAMRESQYWNMVDVLRNVCDYRRLTYLQTHSRYAECVA